MFFFSNTMYTKDLKKGKGSKGEVISFNLLNEDDKERKHLLQE